MNPLVANVSSMVVDMNAYLAVARALVNTTHSFFVSSNTSFDFFRVQSALALVAVDSAATTSSSAVAVVLPAFIV